MAAIQVKSEISINELLKGVEQMDSSSLELFLNQVLHIHAKRKAKSLSKKEAALLLKINSAIPADMLEEIDSLNGKKETAELTEKEENHLKKLILEVEELNANRIQYLGELAALKNIPLRKLMKDLKM